MGELLIITVCLFLNALFAGYEMAFISVSRAQLRALAKTGRKEAALLLNLRENPERTLSVIQIGITMVGAIAAAVGGAGVSDNLEPLLVGRYGLNERTAEIVAILVIVLPITYLSVVIGELVPKTLALRHPLPIALYGAPALFIADRALSPVISALEGSTKGLLSLFFHEKRNAKQPAEPASLEIESFSPIHRKFLINLAELEKTRANDILLPWPQVVTVRSNEPLAAIGETIIRSGHTRLPVMNGDEVIGILHTKEFIAFRTGGETDWHHLIRPVIFTYAGEPILGLLRTLQSKKNHLTVIVDSKNSLRGIVTLEDILEEIVGEIGDEDDDGQVRRLLATRASRRSRGTGA